MYSKSISINNVIEVIKLINERHRLHFYSTKKLNLFSKMKNRDLQCTNEIHMKHFCWNEIDKNLIWLGNNLKGKLNVKE